MPNRRTRNRQLARVAQRRYAERRRRRQRRARTISAALVIAVAGGGVAFVAFTGNGAKNAATGSPTPSASPGTRTGAVPPPKAAKNVACGASAPKSASVAKPQFTAPSMTIDTSKTYTATIDTSCGTIVIRLLTDRAPQTVNSFVFLADEHFFDATQIHRIDTGIDVIQGGDPTATGKSGPGYTIPDETTGKEAYGPGVVAMANTGRPDSGGSQFFIVFGPNGHKLDDTPTYTIFGKVVKGLDVARKIGALPIAGPRAAASGDLAGQRPKQAVYLERVTISSAK